MNQSETYIRIYLLLTAQALVVKFISFSPWMKVLPIILVLDAVIILCMDLGMVAPPAILILASFSQFEVILYYSVKYLVKLRLS